jgi:Tfp pilus assembly protein PilZ
MEERRYERTTRRLPVRFRSRDQPDEPPRRGYTTNVSAGGMYVATSNPFPSGTVLRCQVGDEKNDVVLDGVVAHSHKIARELGTALGTGGMGVRLYSVRELLEQVNPAGTARPEPEPAHEPSPAVPASPPPAAPAPAASSSEGPVLPAEFSSSQAFSEVYHRDAAHGGLFVSTDEAHRLGEIVTVEVRVSGAEPVRLAAQVVHRLGPGELPGGPVGVGVQFLDREAARDALGRLVQ